MPNGNTNKRLNFTLDYRIVSLLLLAVIAAMFLLWRPWQDNISADTRTIKVSGEANLTAEPDEFIFGPAYQLRDEDQQAALDALTVKSEEITAQLKELGVPDTKIKSDSSGYETYALRGDEDSGTPAYTLRFTITVADRELAQKVQDYLVTTSPTGSVSPQATFSDQKRKQLENTAREDAIKEARAKAEQSAQNLGFKLGTVKTVEDGTGFGVFPYAADIATDSTAEASKSLELQPGENELSYTVTVTYFVK
jgi:uncharacterized protein